MVNKGDPQDLSPDERFHILLKQFEDGMVALNKDQRALDSAETTQLRSDLDMMKRAYRQIEDELRVTKNDYETRVQHLQRENQELRVALTSYSDDVSTLDRQITTLQNAGRRVFCLIDGDGLFFSRGLMEEGRSGGLKAARALSSAIEAHLKGSPDCKLWIFCFMNRRGLVSPLNIAENTLNSFISGFNQVVRSFIIDVGHGKEVADNRLRELMIEETGSSHTMRVYFGGCHDNGYGPVLDGLITSKFKSKLFLLPGHVEIAASIRQLGLPSLDIPHLFQCDAPAPVTGLALSAPTSPRTKSSSYEFAPVANTSPVSSFSTNSSDSSQHPEQGLEFTKVVPLDFKQVTRRSPVVMTTTKVKPRYLDPDIAVCKNDPPPCTRHYMLKNCPHGPSCYYSHEYTFRPGDLKRMMDQLPLCPTVEHGGVCTKRDECWYRHHCIHSKACTFWQGGRGRCRAGGDEAHRPLKA